MIEEGKYCSDMIKKHFNKELVMNKEENKKIKNSTKCWICDNDYMDDDVKVRDNCNITGKNRVCAHRGCNINVKLNHKILILFQNLKNHDSHLIMQELGEFNHKINVVTNGLEKYTSFTNNNMLLFIDSFQFLSSSLDSLVKNLSKNDFKFLTQDLIITY